MEGKGTERERRGSVRRIAKKKACKLMFAKEDKIRFGSIFGFGLEWESGPSILCEIFHFSVEFSRYKMGWT